MNRSEKILIGSQVFFGEYSDYTVHDVDYVIFENNPKIYNVFIAVHGKHEDIFHYKTMPKRKFIEYEIEHCKKLPMAAGKFLVPELCRHIKFTIEELKEFQFAFENMDDKHSYENLIFKSYLENGDFTLTQEQRDKAYMEYKSKR